MLPRVLEPSPDGQRLLREYDEPREILPMGRTTQVAVIRDMLLEGAFRGRTNLAEAVLRFRGLP